MIWLRRSKRVPRIELEGEFKFRGSRFKVNGFTVSGGSGRMTGSFDFTEVLPLDDPKIRKAINKAFK